MSVTPIEAGKKYFKCSKFQPLKFKGSSYKIFEKQLKLKGEV